MAGSNDRQSPRATANGSATRTRGERNHHSRHRSWSPVPHHARGGGAPSASSSAAGNNHNNTTGVVGVAVARDRSHSPTRPSTATATRQRRRRAYSWRGESPPYEKSPSKETMTEIITGDPVAAASKLLWPIARREAQCVAAWIIGVVVIQLAISMLVSLASYAYPLSIEGSRSANSSNGNHPDDNEQLQPETPSTTQMRIVAWWKFLMVGPSILSGCLLRFIPPQVISNQYPGFIYASAWLLMGIKDRMGSLPHIPSRICEAVLGRLSAVECFVIVGVQMVCTLLIVSILTYTSNIAAMPILSPIEYTNRSSSSSGGAGNPWIVDFFKELLVTTVFTVALQVVPVLLRLNRASVWFTYLFIYPLYTYGVDSVGCASTLSPSILFALSCTDRHKSTIHSFGRCIPQFLAGILAGNVMTAYFPDDPSPTKRRL